MPGKSRVHLVGGDHAGWALDMDLRLAKEALSDVVELVSEPSQADVIHSVNAEQLVIDPRVRALLTPDKRVVAHFTSLPSALFEQIPGIYSECRKWICIAQTREAEAQLRAARVPTVKYVPYVGDLVNFYPIPAQDPKLQALREELGIPNGKYVIGSFQRDTLGVDLTRFKAQKGPDVFLSIVLGAQKRLGSDRIHVLLAGPRRHWLRSQLEKHGVSYSFDGRRIAGDDYPENILSLERINALTGILDLYMVTSRWEGAPQAIFETIACRRKIISSAVAVARDILSPAQLFTSLSEAIDAVVSDVEGDTLAQYIDTNHRTTFEGHSTSAVKEHWRRVYDEIVGLKSANGDRSEVEGSSVQAVPSAGIDFARAPLFAKSITMVRRLRTKLLGRRKTIALWGEMVSGP